MTKVQTTRMELLARKSRLKLTRQAHSLLEKKRIVLMREIMKVVDSVIDDRNGLQRAANRTRYALSQAEAIAGEQIVRSASLAVKQYYPLQIEMDNIMGINVPRFDSEDISRDKWEFSYAVLGTPIVIDEVVETTENEIEAIIKLANSELRLNQLLDEFQKTTRRLNALEHRMIPKLELERGIIQSALDERERADHFRLKLAKRLLEKRSVNK